MKTQVLNSFHGTINGYNVHSLLEYNNIKTMVETLEDETGVMIDSKKVVEHLRDYFYNAYYFIGTNENNVYSFFCRELENFLHDGYNLSIVQNSDLALAFVPIGKAMKKGKNKVR